ncbi:MAG: hypothetical protein ACJASQ_004264 [Crocinitomicaceae bacterium]|jgi:hypothetical protein
MNHRSKWIKPRAPESNHAINRPAILFMDDQGLVFLKLEF